MTDTSNKILKLNGWISYDSIKGRFILAEHSIKIPYTEFSIDGMETVNKKRKLLLKEVMETICAENGIYNNFKNIRTMRQHKTGNTNKNNMKNSIEGLILRRSGIMNAFDIVEVTDLGIQIKRDPDKEN